jgi:hypothetical protein
VSISAQIDPASTSEFGNDYTLSVTTSQAEINGELTPNPDSDGFTHVGIFILEDDIFGPIPLRFGLNTPEYTDVNGNGLDDFFDADQPVSAQTDGSYENEFSGNNPFTARWSREAGSNTGTVQIHLPDLGLTFDHVFRLIAYDGTFTHTLEGQHVTGTVQLANVHDPADTISGTLDLTVVDNLKLTWEKGAWSGVNGFSWDYNPLDTFDVVSTAYASVFLFRDGFPPSGSEDYPLWVALIAANDVNNNRVPDLVENGGTPVEPPQLAIVKAATGFVLTITGSAGQTYSLQSADKVDGPWSPGDPINMATETQTVNIANEGAAKFYRLKL